MQSSKWTALLAAAGIAGGTLTGCVGVDNRLNNQGGGNIVTAAAKLASGALSDLTADEIQAATDFAIDTFGVAIPSLDDDQAAAVAQFLEDNDLNSVEDIQALAENPGDVVISDDVKDAVESLLAGLGETIDFDRVGAQGGDGPAFPPNDFPSDFDGVLPPFPDFPG